MPRSCTILGAIILAASSVQAVEKPATRNRALWKADRVTATATSTWKKFDPASDAYVEAINAVKQSGAFAEPITLSITDVSLKPDGKTGGYLVEGVCQERRKSLGRFRAKDEHQYRKDFEDYTEQILTEFDAEMEALESTGELRGGTQQAGSPVVISRKSDPEEFAAYIAMRKREQENVMRVRLRDRGLLFGDLDMIAESRRKKLAPLRIHATMTPEVAATRKLRKLASLGSLTLTLEVESFELHAGNKEINHPVSIGSLTGKVLAISPGPRNANMQRRGRLPKRVAP